MDGKEIFEKIICHLFLNQPNAPLNHIPLVCMCVFTLHVITIVLMKMEENYGKILS